VVVALSVACAIFYGAADFCGGLAARRMPAVAVLVWSQAVGFVILLAVMPFIPGVPHPSDFGWGAACGVAGAAAVGLLYRALAVGTMGVISPITAVLAAAVPVTFAFFHGDRPAPIALVGIGLALVAVVLVSAVAPMPPEGADAPLARSPKPHRFPPGIPEALGAGLAFGFFFIAFAQTHTDSALYPLLSTRVTSLALLASGGLALRLPLRVHRPGMRILFLCGSMDMAANILYVLAVHRGALSIVAVITSLYPVATVALAAAMLRERLVPVQWVGVAIALTGVICIALAR
jgi:drug/metabolite transporter (DMT)-like permease